MNDASGAGTSLVRASGTTDATRAGIAAHDTPKCPISTSLVGGPAAWLSSAALELRTTVVPSTGSTKRSVARPSQNHVFANAALIIVGAFRPVTCGPSPQAVAKSLPSEWLPGTSGEPMRSSGVLNNPSGPGWTVPPALDRDPLRASPPRFVERELRAYRDCGILAKGFARVHCSGGGKDGLVAFSCKKRGCCPSCGARRMVDRAAHWIDRVLPDVPIRQWVLSLPFELRYRLGYDAKLLGGVRRVFLRAVQPWVERRMRDLGVPESRTGAVVCVQRHDSARRLDPHLHALVLDGVFTGLESSGSVEFHALPKPTDADIEGLVRSLCGRVVSFCTGGVRSATRATKSRVRSRCARLRRRRGGSRSVRGPVPASGGWVVGWTW